MNGEDELQKMRAELAEMRRSFNLFVRSQASLVAALRQAEESNQARHRLTINAIGNLRPLAMALADEPTERVLVTDRPGQTGQVPVLAETKPKGEISGSIKVGGVKFEATGEGEHFKELAWKVGKWVAILVGMVLTGGIGWLIGFLKRLGEAQK